MNRPRRVYETTAKVLSTLYYWRLNGKNVNRDDLFQFIKSCSFKSKGTRIRKRIESLASRGIIYFIDDQVFLTDKGLWYVENREKTIHAILYGHVLKQGHASQDAVRRMYQTLSYRLTHDNSARDRTLLILKRLKREGGIDYTDDEVWCTKEVKIK